MRATAWLKRGSMPRAGSNINSQNPNRGYSGTMQNEMETAIQGSGYYNMGLYRNSKNYIGVYRDNGKEKGSYYSILRLYWAYVEP